MAKKKGKGADAEAKKEGEDAPKIGKPTADYSGAHLRKVREGKGLTIADVSERTKISKAVLNALEAERYEDMPNARVYVRGFVRCVARELDLDLDQVTQAYLPKWERWFAEHGEVYDTY